jgi:hypothetical protein
VSIDRDAAVVCPDRMRKSARMRWLRDHSNYEGDDCLIWPFAKNWNGYGHVSIEGSNTAYTHRVMCIFAHGPPPTPKHQAAHSCNNGHGGCVNPRHLSWKTNPENMADRHAAGTLTKRRWNRHGLVTPEQIAQIIALKGQKNQREIAAMFGISPQHVSTIQLGRLLKQLSPDSTFPTDGDGPRLSQTGLSRRLGRDPKWIRDQGDYVTDKGETWVRAERPDRRVIGYTMTQDK